MEIKIIRFNLVNSFVLLRVNQPGHGASAVRTSCIIINMDTVKLVVYVPETHADIVRKAMGEAGAGIIGDYKFCSFSIKGIGRFIPLELSHPTIGKIGKLEEVTEERIETVCYKKDLDKIIKAIKKVHPYEEVALDVYPLVLNPRKTTYKNR